MDNKMRKLTQAWMMIAMISASLWLIGAAEAGVWRDDFSGEALKDAWTLMGASFPQFFTWEVKDGFLHVIQVKPVAPKEASPLEALQLTAFPGVHQQFTITATNLKTIKSGGFGIALGKRFPPPPEAPPVARWLSFWYVFFTHRIYPREFDGTGGSGPFRWVPTNPGTIWDTRELKEMKLIFNAGRFQIFADSEPRADFEDNHFDQIELISFVMSGSEQAGAEGWAGSFEIYDSALFVEPKGKLATTWGKMKGRH